MIVLVGMCAAAMPAAAAPPAPGKGAATIRVMRGVEAICSEDGGRVWMVGDVRYTADVTQRAAEITDEPLLAGGVVNIDQMQLNLKTLEGIGWGQWTMYPTALKGKGRWEGTYTYAFAMGPQGYSEIQGIATGKGELRGLALMVRARFAPQLRESLRPYCGGELPVAVTEQTFWLTEVKR
jgi:hypothetical protein